MPTDNDIDYRQFTRAQLLEALANINAQQFPQNYQHLIAEIASRDAGDRPEIPPERPKPISRLMELRGDVTGSIGTKSIYGAFGVFYLCMPPVILIWGSPQSVELARAVAVTAIIWAFAAVYLFGFCVTYRFESGVVKCLWFGHHIIWEDKLDTLQDVKSDFIKGLPTIYFVWPDHKRRLWLRVSDLDSANAIA
jgi:hypothetical protein